jgi:hypothetical protein
MGLYLCVFENGAGDEEVDGVEVGSYEDFKVFRETISGKLENGKWGERFPVLMTHSDSDGVWSPSEAAALEDELSTIQRDLSQLPPVPLDSGWQGEVARRIALVPESLLQCFIDVDGELLVERLIGLARVARQSNSEIWFQ